METLIEFQNVCKYYPMGDTTVVAADRGVPVVYLEQDCPAKQAFLHLADAIAQAADSGAAKLVSKS